MDATRAHSIFWLRGVAGSGKSTLSTSIATELRRLGRLGAFLFFERDVTERNDPSLVIRTLAYRVGLLHPRVGSAIASAIQKHPDISQLPLQSQFQYLIVEPLSVDGILDPDAPFVFILDALDECGNADRRDSLLELLAEHSHILPVLFLITSRPDHDICGFLEGRHHVMIHELDISNQDTADDITAYLTDALARIRRKTRSLRTQTDWPGIEIIQKLAERASGLFIWASTACKFIDAYSPESRLKIILRGPGANASGEQNPLDSLYRTALMAMGSWDNPEFIADFRDVMGLVLGAKSPLSENAIVALLGTPTSGSWVDIISRLGCVLQQQPTVRLLHPSFADFLSTRSRCAQDNWFFEETKLPHFIASKCLRRLNATLRYNMCNLTLSPHPVNTRLPEDIVYACMWAIEHIYEVEDDDITIIPHLGVFLQSHLLHWFEAMSILKSSSDAIVWLLRSLNAWINVSTLIFTQNEYELNCMC